MEFSSFDTYETQLYKLAQEWGVPPKMIIVLKPYTNSPEYINADQLIRDKLETLELAAIETFLRIKSRKSWSEQIIEVMLLVLVEELRAKNTDLDAAIIQTQSMAAVIVNKYLARINDFQFEQRTKTQYTIKSLIAKYNTIVKARAVSLKRVASRFSEIIRVQKRYTTACNNPPLRSSNLIIILEDIRYAMVLKDTRNMPPMSAIFSIFDTVTLTRNVPHMLCKDVTGTQYQKIYTTDPLEKPIPSKYFLDTQIVVPNFSIVFNIIENGNIYTVYWMLESGYAEVNSVKGVSRARVDSMLNQVFPNIVIESAENSVTSYELRLYPIIPIKFILKQYILLHRLIVEPEIFQFYLNESTSPYPYKKASELIFRYRPTCTSDYYTEDEAIFTMGLGTTMADTNCIILNVESYSTIGIWRLFSSVIPAICIHFSEDLIAPGRYANLYSKVGPIDPIQIKTKTDLHQLLFDEFPEVFTEAYLYGGTSKKQVHKRNLVKITTDKVLANLWKTQTIEGKNSVISRSVGKFQDTTGKLLFWYTTVTNDTPYLRMMTNTRESHPKYYEVPGSSTAETESKKGKGEIVSANILINSLTALEDRQGVLPSAFDVILPNHRRHGIPKGPNSFLGCVLFGLTNKLYNPAELRSFRLDLISKASNITGKKLNPWRLKQQFYDLPTSTILEYVSKTSEYFDPTLYIGALEEYYDINIYVIVPTTEFNITTLKFCIPRHNQFYARNSVLKKCIIIFCHSGVQSDNLAYPHCEIIVNADTPEDFIMDVEVSQTLQEIFVATTTSEVLSTDNLYTVEFMNSSLDIELAKPEYKIYTQYIDGYGKSRAITVKERDLKYTIITEPREPCNVNHSYEIIPLKYDMILKLSKNKPIGQSGLGVWIPWKRTTSIVYLRVADLDSKEFNSIEHIGVDPLLSTSNLQSVIQTYAQKEREFTIITQLIKWLFEIFYTETKLDYLKFVESYIAYKSKPVNEDTYYNITQVTQVIPNAESLGVAIKFVKQVIPSKSTSTEVSDYNTLFFLHNQEFHTQITYILMKHQRSVRLIAPIKSQRIISGFYRSIFDFKQQPNTKIYTSNVSARDIVSRQNPFQIVDIIIYNPSRKIPIVYRQTNKLYLIQNTILEDLSSALQISITWAIEGYNIGYNPVPMNTRKEILSHSFVIFKVYNGTLVCVYTNIIQDIPPVFILDYMTDVVNTQVVKRKRIRDGRGATEDKSSRKRYAAVLPI